MTESQSYQKIKPIFESAGWLTYRIETGETQAGFPDMLLISPDGETIYCESKAVSKPNKEGLVIPKWRPGQLGKLNELRRQGCITCLMIAVGEDIYFNRPFKERFIKDVVENHVDTCLFLRLPFN